MKTKALILSFLTLTFGALAQLLPLPIPQAAQVADALSPTWASDQTVNEFRCITEFRTNRTARVISGQLVFGATVESVKVLCPTDITPDGKEFKFFLQHPRVYQRQVSSDGFRTWKTNLVIIPQPPPPPKPDFTGMTIEQIMSAMRAWNLASIQSGRSAVPDHTKSDTHFSKAGTRYVDVSP